MHNVSTRAARRPRPLAAVAAGAAVVVGLLATTASASGPDRYTGCLQAGTGRLYAIAAGDMPLAPCHAGDTQVMLGSGVITSILGQAGIVVSTTGGNVTIGLDTDALDARYARAGHDHDGRYALAGQNCPAGQFARGFDATGTIVCGGLRSPNGEFSVTIGDEGIELKGPGTELSMNGSEVLILTPTSGVLMLNGQLHVGASVPVSLFGPLVHLGCRGSGNPVARVADDVVASSGGTGSITTGSAVVTAC